MLYERSTLERNELVKLKDQATYQQYWVRSDYAGDVDKQFRRVWIQAQTLEPLVNTIWSQLDIKTTRAFQDSVRATAEARRAIAEIKEIEPFPSALAGTASPTTGLSTKPSGGFAVAVGWGGATAAATVGATPMSSGKGSTAYGAQPWTDDQLPMRDELGNRYNRTRAWCKVFINFRKNAACLTGPKSTLPKHLKDSLSTAIATFDLCDSDCTSN